MKNRKIAVSGTPGTGKSTFAQKLAEDLDYDLIDLNEKIREEGIYDEDSDGTMAVSTENLRKIFEDILTSEKGFVIDGLLSYLLSPEQVTDVVVLRTRPKILKTRLEKRDYSESKLKDNVESEALGVVLEETVDIHGPENVYEIDTTDLSPQEVLKMFKEGLEGKRDLSPGSVDWLEGYYENNILLGGTEENGK